MTYLGTVHRGVVVLPEEITLPEGSSVRIEPVDLASSVVGSTESIWDMSDLAFDAGVPDLAANIDHYLYGHPKATDGQ